jgi:hypothetical protein
MQVFARDQQQNWNKSGHGPVFVISTVLFREFKRPHLLGYREIMGGGQPFHQLVHLSNFWIWEFIKKPLPFFIVA